MKCAALIAIALWMLFGLWVAWRVGLLWALGLILAGIIEGIEEWLKSS